MNAEPIIRRLSCNDTGLFKAIRLEALMMEPDAFASSHSQWVGLTEEECKRRLADPVFAAISNRVPVGMMALRLNGAVKKAHRAALTGVYVRAAFRGAGVAGRLLHAVVSTARGDGIRQIELGVRSDNQNALRFYVQHGFVVVGRIPCGYRDEHSTTGEILMVLQL